ncbi:hypothetical protein ABZY90_36950, partial [Streptomyces sp. NPDC006422]
GEPVGADGAGVGDRGTGSRAEKEDCGDPGHPRNAHKPPKVPAQTDVCALGRKYGGWDPDSPQSAICHDAYGG